MTNLICDLSVQTRNQTIYITTRSRWKKFIVPADFLAFFLLFFNDSLAETINLQYYYAHIRAEIT